MYKNSIVIIFTFICCLFLTGCDFFYKLLDKEGAEEKTLIGKALPFASNPKVEDIQSLLTVYGYVPGNIDGILGAKTRRAIRRFQREHKLKETGYTDKETWLKLNIFVQDKLIIDNQLNIAKIQYLLQKAGFHLGRIDGEFGLKTKKAVINFQKYYHLKVDGKVGYNTLEKLATFIENDN